MTDPGERLFARYANAPNALGYCGPAAASALQRVACGQGDGVDVPALAQQFSGAWPYQELIAEAAVALGHDVDVLSEEVGRAYWTGNALTAEIDARSYGEALLARFSAKAGHYWQHLTSELLDEVTPTHAFHVFGVYPWTRLLKTGLPEPLSVLDSCRIRAGRVLEVGESHAVVETDTLEWDDRSLSLSPSRPERIERRTEDGYFAPGLEPGDLVAVHWNFACDQLTETEAAQLTSITNRQLEVTNARLAQPDPG